MYESSAAACKLDCDAQNMLLLSTLLRHSSELQSGSFPSHLATAWPSKPFPASRVAAGLALQRWRCLMSAVVCEQLPAFSVLQSEPVQLST